ncbi:unnamed protein product [Dibothriocephalus latus]|uniref:BTB domain-containing protein n=1 Tax=Dibothriocephalus latus TaxID=60516 RepID=A0A3P6T031_DIBLA|nr:unnamed protein product [Dibothriocephalus latus]
MTLEYDHSVSTFQNEMEAPARNRQKKIEPFSGNISGVPGLFAAAPLLHDWQSGKSSVSERVRSLFLNPTLADVYFHIKSNGAYEEPSSARRPSGNQSDSSSDSMTNFLSSNQRIPAHSFVLAISSAVFEAMFFGPLASNNRRTLPPRICCGNQMNTVSSSLYRRLSSPAINSDTERNTPWTTSLSHMTFPTQPMVTENMISTPQSFGSPPPNADPLNVPFEETRRAIKRSSTAYTQVEPSYGHNPSLASSPNYPFEIVLYDVHPVAFINVLRFIYTDEITLDPSNVLQTLYVAKKYAVTMMEHACVDFLSHAISVDNAFLLLTQANFFDENELAQKCLEVIDKNTAKALDSDDFLAVDSQLLCSILERDTLCIREVRLFLSVLRWAKAQYHKQKRLQDGSNGATRHHKRSSLSSGTLFLSPSGDEPGSLLSAPPPRPSSTPLEPVSTSNSSGSRVQSPDAHNVETTEAEPPVEALREILAPIVPLIRFPQMSVEEFAEVVVPSKVLEDSKAVELFLYYVSNTKPAVPYSTKSRCYLRAAEEIVRRFGAVDQRWDYRGTSDRIRLVVINFFSTFLHNHLLRFGE